MSLVCSKSLRDKAPGIGQDIGPRTILEIGPKVRMKVRPGISRVMEPTTHA